MEADSHPSNKVIGTHSGSFHVDEALACFMLLQTDEFANSKIVRSRDPALLNTCNILVDVGAVYDPTNHRYDHHQAGFTETLDANHTMKLSSAGLIYKHFGKQVIQKVSGITDEKTLNVIFQNLYTNFIEALDGIDNGVKQYDTTELPRYIIKTDLSSRVGYLNPEWNQPNSPELADELFQKAVALAGSEFLSAIRGLTDVWLPARTLVVDALNQSSGGIMILQKACPWKEHLFSVEEEYQRQGETKYVIFQDTRGDYMIQSAPLSPSSFDNRAPFPSAWRGIRDEALSQLIGISGCIFVHANGFIGGNKTLEGALEMAKKSLALQ